MLKTFQSIFSFRLMSAADTFIMPSQVLYRRIKIPFDEIFKLTVLYNSRFVFFFLFVCFVFVISKTNVSNPNNSVRNVFYKEKQILKPPKFLFVIF